MQNQRSAVAILAAAALTITLTACTSSSPSSTSTSTPETRASTQTVNRAAAQSAFVTYVRAHAAANSGLRRIDAKSLVEQNVNAVKNIRAGSWTVDDAVEAGTSNMNTSKADAAMMIAAARRILGPAIK